jgi:hypothetical protein
MDRRVELGCAYCGPLFLLLFMIGYWFVAGLLPPPSSADGALRIASFYRADADQLRVGMIICLFAMPLMVPFLALITVQIIRSNPRMAPLAYTQFACGFATMLLILIAVVLIATAAFRPERSPETTRTLNDIAFIMFVWAPFPVVIGEYVSIGLAVLLNPKSLYPRWVGWFELFLAALFLPAAPMIFAKRGWFSWQGALPFWLGFAAFGAWFVVMFISTMKAIDREPALQAREAVAA